MTISVNGKSYTQPELLIYWIKERYRVLISKQEGLPKPWSDDDVFKRTYFCNVHREDDRVTRWIRSYYSPYVGDDLFEYNIILSRFLNWPPTLDAIGYQKIHDPNRLGTNLGLLAEAGKIWGGAYVITTHGIPMPKATYLCQNVLEGVHRGLDDLRKACRGVSCAAASRALQGFEGLGSFLAAQVVADLKNTPGHPLYGAIDRWTFVEPGPGSLRGVSWFCNGDSKSRAMPAYFSRGFAQVRNYVNVGWPKEIPIVDNQDLQNCLCEYDKYCRVATGSGRSKRGYNGA